MLPYFIKYVYRDQARFKLDMRMESESALVIDSWIWILSFIY